MIIVHNVVRMSVLM